MQDYEKMYFILFNKITDVSNQLKEVQTKTEEIYVKQQQKAKIIPMDLSENLDNSN